MYFLTASLTLKQLKPCVAEGVLPQHVPHSEVEVFHHKAILLHNTQNTSH